MTENNPLPALELATPSAESLELNQVHQGDCVELLNRLEPGSVDLVFADPPFNIGYAYDVYDDAQNAQTYLDWCRQWIAGIHRCLNPQGTFWLAIGDEYAAELKIAAQQAGFHCRSWVIWYYTFGVNCVNGFSRSHTHLFHFVKNKKSFTFNRINPQIRVKSARQLVYADLRANPDGRLPDNTWITRPQDAPYSFSPSHDTWYFARVAGTFKEREGFHGCQMPEQLLARIIRASSQPLDLVLDPFSGSGTSLAVAKKLGRKWLGFELSPDYAQYIDERLRSTKVGAPIDGVEDPIQSAPETARGKTRKSPADLNPAILAAFKTVSPNNSVADIVCDPELNRAFVAECTRHQIPGNAFFWNRALFELQRAKSLGTHSPGGLVDPADWEEYASPCEIAWRLLSIDYRKTLEEILCSPEMAAEFDRLATIFGSDSLSPRVSRLTALAVREQANQARQASDLASMLPSHGSTSENPVVPRLGKTPDLDWHLTMANSWDQSSFETPGLFRLANADGPIFVDQTENLRKRLGQIHHHPEWRRLNPTILDVLPCDHPLEQRLRLKAIALRHTPTMLNCQLFASPIELPEWTSE